MTVREAFEKAGHPVPEGARILCFCQAPSENKATDWRHTGLNDKSYIGAKVPLSGLFRPCHRGVWAWDESHASWGGIDLSNTPAIDAYDALPECIQKVVKP